jgi:hypothetical protein
MTFYNNLKIEIYKSTLYLYKIQDFWSGESSCCYHPGLDTVFYDASLGFQLPPYLA